MTPSGARAEVAPSGRQRASRTKDKRPTARAAEFGAFLRARRQSLTREDVGLPAGRRHGCSLRREEVASLAGVSHAWYTRLEQGANVRPTLEVVNAIGHALRLDDLERAYLRHLAGSAKDGPRAQPPPVAETADLQEVVDRFLPNPALIVSDLFEYIVWNDAYVSLFGLDPGSIDPAHRNLLWVAFVGSARREADEHAARLIASFRWYSANRVGDPEFSLLTEDLSAASEAFRTLWTRGLVGGPSRRCAFEHPRAGVINLRSTWLAFGHVAAVLQVTTPLTTDDQLRLAAVL